MLSKPEKCCDFWEFKCSVPVVVKNKVVECDYCISDIVCGLNAAGIHTTWWKVSFFRRSL